MTPSWTKQMRIKTSDLQEIQAHMLAINDIHLTLSLVDFMKYYPIQNTVNVSRGYHMVDRGKSYDEQNLNAL